MIPLASTDSACDWAAGRGSRSASAAPTTIPMKQICRFRCVRVTLLLEWRDSRITSAADGGDQSLLEDTVMAPRFVRVLACLWLLMVWIAPAGAQQFTGGVRGAVRDANGVVPGVAVTMTNEA